MLAEHLLLQGRHRAGVHPRGANDLSRDDVGRILAEHEGSGVDLDAVSREAAIDAFAGPLADELDEAAGDRAEVVVPGPAGADGNPHGADDLFELALDIADLGHGAQVEVVRVAEPALVARRVNAS